MPKTPPLQHKTAPGKVSARQRELDALTLRKAGATFDQIKDEVGYKTRSAAYKAVMRALHRLADEARDETEALRAMELIRIDTMWLEAWRLVLDRELPNRERLNAMKVCVSLIRERAQIGGLRIPAGLEVDARVSGNIDHDHDHTHEVYTDSQLARGLAEALTAGLEAELVEVAGTEVALGDLLAALTRAADGRTTH